MLVKQKFIKENFNNYLILFLIAILIALLVVISSAIDPVLPLVILVIIPLIISLAKIRFFLIIFLAARISIEALEPLTQLQIGNINGIDTVIIIDLLIILIGFLSINAKPRIIIHSTLPVSYFPLIIITIFVGLFFSPLKTFIPFVIRILAPISMYIIIVNTLNYSASPQATKKWYKLLLVSAIVPIGIALYQIATKSLPFLNNHYRLIGPFLSPSPVGFSLYLLVIIFIFYGLYLRRISMLRTAIIIGLSILLFLTYTRGAIVGFGVGLILIDTLNKKWFRVGGLISLVILILFLFPELFARFQGIIEFFHSGLITTDTSLLTRLNLQTTMLPYIVDSPILGNGIGSFALIFEEISGIPKVAPHNDYLYLTVELGLLGLSSYLLIQIVVLLTLWKSFNSAQNQYDRQALIVAFVTYLIINVVLFFENSIFFIGIQIYIMSLVALAQISTYPAKQS